MFKDALRSLKNNFSRALFYWLTFVITSMFIFLFFNISMGDTVGVHFVNNTGDMATTITVFVITICMIIIFFANDFYVKNKARDLAVRLVCGATYSSLASYLLSQTFLLLFLAIPTGIILALFLMPVINGILSASLSESFRITIHSSAVWMTVLILVMVVFWTTYLNLAFAYRHSAADLLNDRKIRNPLSGVQFYAIKKKSSGRWKRILSLVLFLFPLPLFYTSPDAVLVLSIFGMTGLSLSIKNVIIPWINRRIVEEKIGDPLSVARLGFLRNDLQILKNNIILFVITVVLLIAVVLTRNNTAVEKMLALLSYVVMNMLLSFAIMFKYSTELASRKKPFRTLDHLGFTPEQLRGLIKSEVFSFYGFTLGIAMLYLGNLFLSMIFNGSLQASDAGILTVFIVLPMILCALITLYYYNRTIFPKEKR